MIGNVFSVYIFRQFFLTFPKELEEAAIVDGAGRFQIFFRIALPLARAPAIAATVIVFTLNWNNFLWPLLVTFDEDMKTMPVGIAAFAPVIGTHTQLEGYAVGDGGGDAPVHPERAPLPAPAALFHPGHQRRQRQGLSRSHAPCRPICSSPARPCQPPPAERFATIDPPPRSRSPKSPAAGPPMSITAVRAGARRLLRRLGAVTPAARGRLLLRLADIVAAHKEELARASRPRTSASHSRNQAATSTAWSRR